MFHRLRSFVVDGAPPGDYRPPTGGEVLMVAKRHAPSDHTGDGGSSSTGSTSGGGGAAKPVKLLRRHTNRQAYPEGLKRCLSAFALRTLAAPPLAVAASSRLNDAVLSLSSPDRTPPRPRGGTAGDGSGGASGSGADADAAAFLRHLAAFAWPRSANGSWALIADTNN